jgi:hypothetical protein
MNNDFARNLIKGKIGEVRLIRLLGILKVNNF